MHTRTINFEKAGQHSFFLWGARQTGKSTLLKERYSQALYFDLLLSNIYRQFLNSPWQFREVCLAEYKQGPIIVDEVQKLPILLDEIHWLIENKGWQFILSGSSPRKIIRENVNLLGGRAIRFELYPLSFSEIKDFDLLRALNHGLLPRHYDAKEADMLIESYIGNYLKDEIAAETKIRNLDVFSKFLNQAAFSNGEIANYTSIAADCGVSNVTVREYFQILEDTLIGNFVESYRKKPKRRIIASPKFYFFDIGIAHSLQKRKNIAYGSIDFGHAFEHFIYMELKSYSRYSRQNFPISYWRTSSGYEVDFILGDHDIAIEVKGNSNIQNKHLKGLIAFSEEYTPVRKIVVSLENYKRLHNDIEIWPWNRFLESLWSGELI